MAILNLLRPNTKLIKENFLISLKLISKRKGILLKRRSKGISKLSCHQFVYREKERRLAEERLRKINEEQDLLRKKRE